VTVAALLASVHGVACKKRTSVPPVTRDELWVPPDHGLRVDGVEVCLRQRPRRYACVDARGRYYAREGRAFAGECTAQTAERWECPRNVFEALLLEWPEYGHEGSAVMERFTGASALERGGLSGCGIWNGRVRCWGLNDNGALGYATRDTCYYMNSQQPCSAVPREVPGPTGIVELASAFHENRFLWCARTSAGAAWCWGDFGVGDFVGPCSFKPARSPEPSPCVPAPPRLVGGLPALVQIVGNEAFYGLDAQGWIHRWGRAGATGVDRATPRRFSQLERVKKLAAGGSLRSEQQACALLHDGTVQCWGRAFTSGSRPDADLESERPRAVVGVGDAVDLDMGASFACALQRDRSVVCWGGGRLPGASEDQLPPVAQRWTARPVSVRPPN